MDLKVINIQFKRNFKFNMYVKNIKNIQLNC